MKIKALNKKSCSIKIGKSVDITSGKILPNLVAFMIPLILTGFLQQFYNTADSIIVGNFGGKEALAAVGATSSTIAFTVSTLLGLYVGTNILVARAKGAGNDEALKKTVSTAYAMTLVLGVLLTTVAFFLARPLLDATKCPENIIDRSEIYLKIYFLGIPGTLFNNFASSVIRNVGDSRTPFIYLTISGATNVVCNLIFVSLFKNAVVSVAVATVISVYIATTLFFIHLVREKGACKLYPFKIHCDFDLLKRTVKLGIPAVISSGSFSATNLIIQPALNAFGDVGVAGSAASSSVEAFLYAITSSISVATSVFIGQNIGAGNKERVVKILKTTYLFTICLMAVYTVISIVFGRQLIALFVPDEPEAIAFGQYRSLFIMGVAVINGIMNVNGGAAQAYGYTMLQMMSNLIGVCLFRVVWMLFVYPNFLTPTALFVCYPISWVLTATTLFTIVMIITKRYLKGKIHNI